MMKVLVLRAFSSFAAFAFARERLGYPGKDVVTLSQVAAGGDER
jgi:hypothetical protein